MSTEKIKSYYTDPELHCWVDCTDPRKTAKCIRASYILMWGDDEQKTKLHDTDLQPDCDIGPVRFRDEVICGASIDADELV